MDDRGGQCHGSRCDCIPEQAYALIGAHGEARWTGALVPLTVDGLVYGCLMVMLDSARRKAPAPPLAR